MVEPYTLLQTQCLPWSSLHGLSIARHPTSGSIQQMDPTATQTATLITDWISSIIHAQVLSLFGESDPQ